MGYYVETLAVQFHIPADKVPAAFEALKQLNASENDHLKRGGSFFGGKETAKWFSWMPEAYHLTVKSLTDIFEELGFVDSVENEDGFTLGSYENKTGQEDLFLQRVAEFAEDGYIEWRGEDGDHWKWVCENGKLQNVSLPSVPIEY